MKLNISANIRAFRRERGMTQERLAEALGVTVGAVSKWESGASTPEISLIVELAGLFGTSVDVLLGYELRTGSLGQSLERVRELRNRKRFDEAAAEAERALERYPNSFDAAFGGAVLYSLKGLEQDEKKSYQRALALFERALELIGQNTDSKINEWSIRNYMAEVCQGLGQTDRALELLKANNVESLNDRQIGCILAIEKGEPDEALPYLCNALIYHVTELSPVSTGYLNACCRRGEHSTAIELLEWLYGVLEGLKIPGRVSYLDKLSVQLLTGCAVAAYDAGDAQSARRFLSRALEEARGFDAAPAYNFAGMKFFHGDGAATAFDDFGLTAMEGVENTLKKQDEAQARGLLSLWKELQND